MALPFGPYQGQDLINWQAGNKFLPREFYSLNTTPSTTQASTIGNTGIVNTQAAGSYMGYPSYEAWLLAQGGQGDGGGGGGPDIIEEDKFSMGMSPGALGGKLPGFGNWAKRTFGPLAHAYSQIPTPTNLLMRGWKGLHKWRENKKVEKEARLQQEIKDHNIKAAQDAQAARAHTAAQGRYEESKASGREGGGWYGGSDYSGGKSGDVAQAGPGRDPDDRMAQGGRIGYRNGEFVDENINVEGPGFDVNENIEMASGLDPDEHWFSLWQDLDSKGAVPIEIETLDQFKNWFQKQEMDMDMGSMNEDQGIASLV